MCGRFQLTAPGSEIAEEFDLDSTPVLRPRFNIAPSQPIATIGLRPGGGRGLAELVWGAEAQKPGGRRQINARAETAARAPALRDAFARRRCLVPATGFYEWRRAPGARPRPWLFRTADGRPFAFAGLWTMGPTNDARPGALLLTTDPNELVREVHDRMPVIVARADYDAWLDPLASPADLERLLRPFPSTAMRSLAVSTAVNNAAVDDASCVAPAEPGDAPRP